MIQLQINDFMYSAGIVGLWRIFEEAKLPYELDGQTISFPQSNLDGFAEHYFNCLARRYGHETNYQKIIHQKRFLEHCLDGISTVEQLDYLNKLVEDMKRYLTSNSYKNIYPLLTEVHYDFEEQAKLWKKLTLKKSETLETIAEEVKSLVEQLLQCISQLEHPQVKRYIVPRVLSYQVIQGFWTNVSLLNSTASKKDLYVEYDSYFVEAAQAYLATQQDEKKYAKNKLNCACCANKMKAATEAFDLTWLQKTGVDAARKSSHYWDHQRDIFVCPICNLVYSCVPLGFTLTRGKGLFINNNRSIQELISINSISLRDGVQEILPDELEAMAYNKILDVIVQQAENHKHLEIDNIQIVKFDRFMESRPYTFNILSREKAQVVEQSKRQLQQLVGKFAKEGTDYVNLYQEVMKRLYNGQSLTDLLYRLMRLVIADDYKSTATIYHILAIHHHSISEGGHVMEQVDLSKIRNYGYHLKAAYQGRESKLNGISYRLLNALKVKNAHKFMETLIQAYSYKGLAIPTAFVQALQDSEAFQTIGYAFLIGLHGYNGQKEQKGEQENEKAGINN